MCPQTPQTRRERRRRCLLIFGALLCWPILFLIYKLEARHRNKMRQAKEEAENAFQIPPTPVKRKRALTLPLSESTRQKTFDQERSLFFRLPAEIRNKVYQEYLGYEEISVKLQGEGYLQARPLSSKKDAGEKKQHRVAMDVLPLLRTCRRIYTESLSLLYTRPHYTFSTPASFLFFAATLPPTRLPLFSHITLNLGPGGSYCTLPPSVESPLSYAFVPSTSQILTPLPHAAPSELPTLWTATCSMLSQMSSLRHLRVEVSEAVPFEYGSWRYARLFQGMRVLERRGMDVDVVLGGNFVNKMYRWRWREREVVWMSVDGAVITRRKGDVGEGWEEEWSRIKRDIDERKLYCEYW